jgi:hypothetical protein
MLETVGYFSYPCQSDGYCTFGCGRRPKTLCAECFDREEATLSDNFHPMMVESNDEYVDFCDLCNELF